MRQIKFRVWDIKSRVYHYNEQIGISKYGSCQVLPDKGFSPEECIIQQFIGLIDKNGREIYEGDILSYKERTHEHGDTQPMKSRVIYDDKHAAFGLADIDKDGEQWIWNCFTDYGLSDFEVVGNIFENK